jgi:hypothetical protein
MRAVGIVGQLPFRLDTLASALVKRDAYITAPIDNVAESAALASSSTEDGVHKTIQQSASEVNLDEARTQLRMPLSVNGRSMASPADYALMERAKFLLQLAHPQLSQDDLPSAIQHPLQESMFAETLNGMLGFLKTGGSPRECITTAHRMPQEQPWAWVWTRDSSGRNSV